MAPSQSCQSMLCRQHCRYWVSSVYVRHFYLSMACYLSAIIDISTFRHDEPSYTVHVYYEDIYNILVFLFAAYVAGLITKAMGMPALVGEIITGFLVSTNESFYMRAILN